MWLVGVFLIELIYPNCSCICSFLQQHPYLFFHFVKMIYIYFIAQIKHIYILGHTADITSAPDLECSHSHTGGLK